MARPIRRPPWDSERAPVALSPVRTSAIVRLLARVPVGAARSGAGLGLGLTLAVAVPTLALAEDWHGRPIIDQGGLAWLVPAAVVALAFFVGGAIPGRRGTSVACALTEGLWVGVTAVLALLAADAVRRLAVNPNLPGGVVGYWAAGASASILFAVAGAAGGQRMASRRRTDQPGGRGSGRAASPPGRGTGIGPSIPTPTRDTAREGDATPV